MPHFTHSPLAQASNSCFTSFATGADRQSFHLHPLRHGARVVDIELQRDPRIKRSANCSRIIQPPNQRRWSWARVSGTDFASAFQPAPFAVLTAARSIYFYQNHTHSAIQRTFDVCVFYCTNIPALVWIVQCTKGRGYTAAYEFPPLCVFSLIGSAGSRCHDTRNGAFRANGECVLNTFFSGSPL